MALLRPLRFSQAKRPLWLLLALAIGILVGLNSPGAQARPVALLLQNLGRDLGALRVQLEQVAGRPAVPGTAQVAFNADLGDGGAGFHRQAMASTLRTAQRSATLLDQRYRQEGDTDRIDLAGRLGLGLHELDRQVSAMQRAPDAETLIVLWAAAEAWLHDLDEILAALRGGEPSETAALAP